MLSCNPNKGRSILPFCRVIKVFEKTHHKTFFKNWELLLKKQKTSEFLYVLTLNVNKKTRKTHPRTLRPASVVVFPSLARLHDTTKQFGDLFAGLWKWENLFKK